MGLDWGVLGEMEGERRGREWKGEVAYVQDSVLGRALDSAGDRLADVDVCDGVVACVLFCVQGYGC